MEHIPITESDVEKVYRIAGELGIGLEEAAITCAGFELAFSDDRMRRAIFGLIDELDYEAYKKGEPLAMILSYAVELGIEGIQVTRHANDIPPGQIVSLTPTNRAMIFVKIKDNFPTQMFLGPLIVNRPEWEFERDSRESEFDRDSSERHFGRDSFDTEIPTDLSTPEPTKGVHRETTRTLICLGPIRHTFYERFPFVSARTSRSPRAGASSGGYLSPVTSHLSRSAASSGGYLSPVTGHRSLAASHLSPVTSHLSRSAVSGLSPPYPSENLGHSERKMFLRQ